jgi:hypothetical protein
MLVAIPTPSAPMPDLAATQRNGRRNRHPQGRARKRLTTSRQPQFPLEVDAGRLRRRRRRDHCRSGWHRDLGHARHPLVHRSRNLFALWRPLACRPLGIRPRLIGRRQSHPLTRRGPVRRQPSTSSTRQAGGRAQPRPATRQIIKDLSERCTRPAFLTAKSPARQSRVRAAALRGRAAHSFRCATAPSRALGCSPQRSGPTSRRRLP